MKSYLEFVYLFQVVLCICSSLLSGYLLNQYIDKKRMVFTVILCNLILVFLYSYLSFITVFLLEFSFVLFYCRKLSLLFCQLVIRYFIVIIMFLLFDGTIYYGIWFMKVSSYQWLLCLFILCIFTYVLLYRCSSFRKIKEYCFEVTIRFDNYKFRCYGYWDSGNFASVNQVPIIFLHYPNLLLIDKKEIAFVQNQMIEVVSGTIVGVHIPKQNVYIAYLEKDIQNLYSCLLNQLLER